MTFSTLSALCQHVESERCGVLRFKAAREGMHNLLSDMHRLRIQGEREVVCLHQNIALRMKIKVSYQILKVRDSFPMDPKLVGGA